MEIDFRLAQDDDFPAIASLLSVGNNPYGWSERKLRYYYREYTEASTIASVAMHEGGTAVGFYGAQGVRVGEYFVISGAHAMVDPEYRGHHLWGTVLEVLCEEGRRLGAKFLMGYANPRFTMAIVNRYGYILTGYAHFVDVDEVDYSPYRERLRFNYSDAWYEWKFGFLADYYLKEYDRGQQTYLQLHKARIDKVVAPPGRRLNLWHPAAYSREDPGIWSQSVAIKPLVDGLDQEIFDIHNWQFDMADNDSIEFREWT
jgi:hypothetical protein